MANAMVAAKTVIISSPFFRHMSMNPRTTAHAKKDRYSNKFVTGGCPESTERTIRAPVLNANPSSVTAKTSDLTPGLFVPA